MGKNYFFNASLISVRSTMSAGVGAGSAGFSSSVRLIFAIARIIIKMINPRITKLIESVINCPYLIAGAQASSRAASVV